MEDKVDFAKEPPRIRGGAFKYENSMQWGWQMIITFGDMSIEDPGAIVVDCPKRYLNRHSALKEMKRASIDLTDALGKYAGIDSASDYGVYDLKNGFARKTKEEFLAE